MAQKTSPIDLKVATSLLVVVAVVTGGAVALQTLQSSPTQTQSQASEGQTSGQMTFFDKNGDYLKAPSVVVTLDKLETPFSITLDQTTPTTIYKVRSFKFPGEQKDLYGLEFVIFPNGQDELADGTIPTQYRVFIPFYRGGDWWSQAQPSAAHVVVTPLNTAARITQRLNHLGRVLKPDTTMKDPVSGTYTKQVYSIDGKVVGTIKLNQAKLYLGPDTSAQ